MDAKNNNIQQILNQCQNFDKELDQFKALIKIITKLYHDDLKYVFKVEIEGLIKNIELPPERLEMVKFRIDEWNKQLNDKNDEYKTKDVEHKVYELLYKYAIQNSDRKSIIAFATSVEKNGIVGIDC